MVSSGLVINESHVEVVIVEHVGGNGITGSISVLCFVMSVGEESSNAAKDGDDDDDDDDGGASSGFDSGGITSSLPFSIDGCDMSVPFGTAKSSCHFSNNLIGLYNLFFCVTCG
jgi:hypothetical protein